MLLLSSTTYLWHSLSTRLRSHGVLALSTLVQDPYRTGAFSSLDALWGFLSPSLSAQLIAPYNCTFQTGS